MGNERELLQYPNMTFARWDAGNMSLRDLIGLFWPNDIGHCARELGLPTIGKDEAIGRLVELPRCQVCRPTGMFWVWSGRSVKKA